MLQGICCRFFCVFIWPFSLNNPHRSRRRLSRAEMWGTGRGGGAPLLPCYHINSYIQSVYQLWFAIINAISLMFVEYSLWLYLSVFVSYFNLKYLNQYLILQRSLWWRNLHHTLKFDFTALFLCLKAPNYFCLKQRRPPLTGGLVVSPKQTKYMLGLRIIYWSISKTYLWYEYFCDECPHLN